MTDNVHDTIREFSRFIKEGDPFGINHIGKSVCDEKFYMERHNSDIMSFEYIVEGKGTLEINGQTLYPQKKDVYILTEGSHHRYFSEKEDPWRKYFVSFRGPLANKMKELYLPYNTYLFKNCDVQENFEKIFAVAFDDTKSYADILNEVTVEVVKIMMYLHGRKNGEIEDLADKIKNKIDYLIEGDFSLDEIAQSLNYSKNHIINVFREKYNKTPYQYYIDAKIETAKRYLQETTCSIADIASNLSFSDPQYFSTSFKKATGLSPREFRRQPGL